MDRVLSYIKQGDIKALDSFDLSHERYIIAACHSGNLEMVKYIKGLGAEYNISTVLKKCIKFKQYDILEYILSLVSCNDIKGSVNMYCIERGDIQGLKLISSKKDAEYSGLILAIKKNNLEIVKYLFETYKPCPAYFVTQCLRLKRHEILEYIIENQDVYITDNQFKTALYKSDIEIFQLILSKYSELPLHLFEIAIMSGEVEKVNLCIPKSLYSIDSCIKTCFYTLNIKMMQLLVDTGVTPEKTTLVNCYNRPDFLELFIKKGHVIPEEAFRQACKYDILKSVKILLENGFKITNTILKETCGNNSGSVLKELIKSGADITIEDNYCLKYACLEGHIEVVKLLVEHGGDIYAENCISLDYACLKGNLKIVKYLVSKGLHLKEELFDIVLKSNNCKLVMYFIEQGICNREYNDLFVLAVEQQDLALVKLLIELGANVNTHSCSPIVMSVKKLDIEMTKYLISKRANVQALNNSPLMWAIVSGSLELTKLLIENGADPKVHNHLPLKLAVNIHWDIVEYLINVHYGGIHTFIETNSNVEIFDEVKKYYKWDLIYRGPITDDTERECGICLQEMKNPSEMLLQCEVCKKCVHKECYERWNKTCIYCRN